MQYSQLQNFEIFLKRLSSTSLTTRTDLQLKPLCIQSPHFLWTKVNLNLSFSSLCHDVYFHLPLPGVWTTYGFLLLYTYTSAHVIYTSVNTWNLSMLTWVVSRYFSVELHNKSKHTKRKDQSLQHKERAVNINPTKFNPYFGLISLCTFSQSRD